MKRPEGTDVTDRHPMQPVVLVDGVARFKQNGIIDWLFNTGRLDLNTIAAIGDFTDEDRMQIAQLLGYSVDGFADLSYAAEDVIVAAESEVARVVRLANTEGTA